ncbi:uncharacterized protein LOC104585442 [Brachypodium distachyon]|uniref:VQ domain-containing protein n=1 Tax=Brachypodium distachyon TaxID=15368 RepID=I1GVY4_BRADI|nr:uncharacterized protein LOC104585442 [Brachypodium distachyon]KQK17029.1 hypothetical protein BRADI_1g32060v3 [Brachypodium distachyon]|eukprot:XP_010240491.1 uncharacterized protein LOC104585442 [Brachypodium distachyon]
MAMCDTGSSFAQWADGLYTYGPSNPAGSPSLGHASDHSTSPPTLSGSDGSPARPATAAAQQQQQQQAGGLPMSKTIKKKRPSTRASRRAPVTLLNTDAANFRAMVQQFTGVPGPVVSFASNDYGHAFQPQPAAASLDHHGHLFHQHQQQQYTGGAFGYGNVLQQQQAAFTGHHGGLGFGSAEDRMLLQSMQQAAAAAAQMPGRNGANGYFA